MARLAKDTRGNVLAIVAGATVPLAAFIGAGLDLSRAYLVRTRLQQACDAGVLAGRRSMGAGGSLTDPVKKQINDFVVFNFPKTSYDTSTFTITPTLDSSTDTINLVLSTQMNTAIMRLFGKNTVPVTVNCSARDDYANIDIVLVLDTTGSMACKPSRTAAQCSSEISNSKRSGKTLTVGTKTVTYVDEEYTGLQNVSRMQGLRDALASLQSQMATIETQFAAAPSASRKRIRWAIVPFSQMTNPGFSTGSAGTTLYARNPAWFNTSGSYREIYRCGGGSCSYAPQTVSHDANWISTTWDGCTEERSTSNSISATSTFQIPGNLPSGANDLLFDLVPSTDVKTRWTMADEGVTGISQYACPKAMRELSPMKALDFNAYFQQSTGFVANGGTYLDIGLLWAARLLSRNGLWKIDNPEYFNGFPVKRYVIFMTDGEMETGNTGYGAYAQEFWSKRITTDGDADTSDNNHTKRWLMTCNAIKDMDTDIYAISFGAGSTLSADMQACSSGAGYGYRAADSAALNRAFQDIGENIGSLRLSK